MRGDSELWGNYLKPGERLIWSGAPKRSSVTQYLLTDAFLFSVVAGILWAYGVHGGGEASKLLYLGVFGAAFYTALLLLFVAGAHQIEYAITEKRILILRRLGSWWLKSYKIGPETELRRGSVFDGVWFSRQSPFGGFPPRFLGIDDQTFLTLEDEIGMLQERMA